jgi:RNA polymerase sigma factor (sigma-70 family)
MVNEYMPRILGWAVKKTGNRDEGEELTQEVFAQFFTTVAKAASVDKPENLLWKVAYYCWCHYLRDKTKQKKLICIDNAAGIGDGTDFVHDLLSEESLASQIIKMRHEISNLSRIQREAMIIHYLEGKSVAETAIKLGTTESAITWHLFDARKKVRREIECMDAKMEYIYRPGKLGIGESGDYSSMPDTKYIRASLIRQNLCLLCYHDTRTIDELVTLTGIPKPYLEFDLDWLVTREFIMLKGKKYATSFPIISRKHFQAIGTLYRDTRKDLIDKVIDYLWSHEDEIRKIGFYGSCLPAERLMWSVVTMFISFVSRNSPLLIRLKSKDSFPVRPDGGKYVVMASDRSEGQELDPNGYSGEILWGGYNGIWSDSCIADDDTDMYYWLGVNTFSDALYCPDIATADKVKRSLLHRVYTSVIEPWFSEDKLESHEKEVLAEAVADGLITRHGNTYKPNFVIFTQSQIDNLRENIYRPLMEMIEPSLVELGKKISAMHKADFPKISKVYVDYHTYVDLWDFGIYTLMYAALDGKLWMPDKPEEGTSLTLVIVMK